jgi:hypothetical protein
VLDATRLGSKARYVNHAPGARANCVPSVKLVDGGAAQRIGLFATAPLPAGTEVLFNYGARYVEMRARIGWLRDPALAGKAQAARR